MCKILIIALILLLLGLLIFKLLCIRKSKEGLVSGPFYIRSKNTNDYLSICNDNGSCNTKITINNVATTKDNNKYLCWGVWNFEPIGSTGKVRIVNEKTGFPIQLYPLESLFWLHAPENTTPVSPSRFGEFVLVNAGTNSDGSSKGNFIKEANTGLYLFSDPTDLNPYHGFIADITLLAPLPTDPSKMNSFYWDFLSAQPSSTACVIPNTTECLTISPSLVTSKQDSGNGGVIAVYNNDVLYRGPMTPNKWVKLTSLGKVNAITALNTRYKPTENGCTSIVVDTYYIKYTKTDNTCYQAFIDANTLLCQPGYPQPVSC